MALRRRFLRRFAPILREVHAALAAKEAGLRLEETAGEGVLRALEASRAEERERGQTLVGPHRDDLVFLLEGRPAHRFASRGEAKTLALALRLAEHRLLGEHHGELPLLLVDEWGRSWTRPAGGPSSPTPRPCPRPSWRGWKPPGVPVCSVVRGVVLCPGA